MQRLISGLAAASNASLELRDRFELPPGRHSGSRCMTIDEAIASSLNISKKAKVDGGAFSTNATTTIF